MLSGRGYHVTAADCNDSSNEGPGAGDGESAGADRPPLLPPIAEREEIIRALEEARLQNFHLKALAITSLTFFSDSYCLFLPTLVSPMLGIVYFRSPPDNGEMPGQNDLLLKGMALVGTFLGMIGFGVYGDLVGRKKAFLPTLLLILVSCLGSALASSTPSGLSMVVIFWLWRFVMGLGIGGDYPLNAVILSEYSPRKFRGSLIAALFAMQGFGILGAALVSMILLRCFKSMILADLNKLDIVWRIIVGFGAVPVLGALILRFRLPESPRFTIEINANPRLAWSNMQALMGFGQVREDVNSNDYVRRPITWGIFKDYVMRHWLILFGPAMAWLLLDIGYYAQNLFSADALIEIGHIPAFTVDDPLSVYNRLFNVAAGQAILAMMGTVPGYWVTVLLVERMGRKPIQLLGFAAMTVCFWVMGLAYPFLTRKGASSWGFIVVYSLTFFFANFGPNATTFIIPAEVFPTQVRATCFGICAAAGKVGAVVATFGFGTFDHNLHKPQVMIGVLSIPMIMGLLVTFLIPETGGRKTLDDIQAQNDADLEARQARRDAWNARNNGSTPPGGSAGPRTPDSKNKSQLQSAVGTWVPSPPPPPFYPPDPPDYGGYPDTPGFVPPHQVSGPPHYPGDSGAVHLDYIGDMRSDYSGQVSHEAHMYAPPTPAASGMYPILANGDHVHHMALHPAEPAAPGMYPVRATGNHVHHMALSHASHSGEMPLQLDWRSDSSSQHHEGRPATLRHAGGSVELGWHDAESEQDPGPRRRVLEHAS